LLQAVFVQIRWKKKFGSGNETIAAGFLFRKKKNPFRSERS